MINRLASGRNQACRLLVVCLAAVFALGAATTAAAQDTSSDTARPASIHMGSCDSPGELVAELGDLVLMFDDDDDQDDGSGSSGEGASTPASLPGSDDDDGDDDNDDNDDDDSGRRLPGTLAFQTGGGGEFVGAEDGSIVEGSEDSAIDVGLDTLLEEPHLIAVFESEGSDTIIACESIGGFVSADDDEDLAVGLRQQNDSGFAGVALLDDDDDDNELDVDVHIARDVV